MWKMLDDLAVTDSAAYAEMAKAGAEAMVRVSCVRATYCDLIVLMSVQYHTSPVISPRSRTPTHTRTVRARVELMGL